MYRNNIKLEIADQKLRLFVSYCLAMPELWQDILEIRQEMKENYSKELALKRNRAILKYRQYREFILPIQDILVTLSDGQIKLLYYRYEQRMTLRQIGELYNYSYMNISRYLDSILNLF